MWTEKLRSTVERVGLWEKNLDLGERGGNGNESLISSDVRVARREIFDLGDLGGNGPRGKQAGSSIDRVFRRAPLDLTGSLEGGEATDFVEVGGGEMKRFGSFASPTIWSTEASSACCTHAKNFYN